MQGEITFFLTAAEMYTAAVELICASAAKATARSGSFSLLLAGGETPLPVYRKLLDLSFPWDKTDFFWGDERCVDMLDDGSNYGNAMKAFLKQAPVAQEHIHRMKTELSPCEAADSYAAELREFKSLSGREKLFDLVLLGMGEDGHTASLFPGSEALKENEKLVVAAKLRAAVPRVTLTYPALADSETVLFMIKGKNKKYLLASGKSFPAAAVKSKKIIWFAA